MSKEELFKRNEAIVLYLGGTVNWGITIKNFTTDHTITGEFVSEYRIKGLNTGGFEDRMLFSNLKFHKSWEWLVPLASKFSKFISTDMNTAFIEVTDHIMSLKQ
jgi:hypothetical protein